jgi:hypothetical protein
MYVAILIKRLYQGAPPQIGLKEFSIYKTHRHRKRQNQFTTTIDASPLRSTLERHAAQRPGGFIPSFGILSIP